MDSSKHKFEKSVYDMKLHEELLADPVTDTLPGGNVFECLPLRVLRVPGGWLYYNMYVSTVGVFVSFDNEFMEKA